MCMMRNDWTGFIDLGRDWHQSQSLCLTNDSSILNYTCRSVPELFRGTSDDQHTLFNMTDILTETIC